MPRNPNYAWEQRQRLLKAHKAGYIRGVKAAAGAAKSLVASGSAKAATIEKAIYKKLRLIR
jgi:hypothetical protein